MPPACERHALLWFGTPPLITQADVEAAIAEYHTRTGRLPQLGQVHPDAYAAVGPSVQGIPLLPTNDVLPHYLYLQGVYSHEQTNTHPA